MAEKEGKIGYRCPSKRAGKLLGYREKIKIERTELNFLSVVARIEQNYFFLVWVKEKKSCGIRAANWAHMKVAAIHYRHGMNIKNENEINLILSVLNVSSRTSSSVYRPLCFRHVEKRPYPVPIIASFAS